MMRHPLVKATAPTTLALSGCPDRPLLELPADLLMRLTPQNCLIHNVRILSSSSAGGGTAEVRYEAGNGAVVRLERHYLCGVFLRRLCADRAVVPPVESRGHR